jgi:hypothetical protein
MTMADNVKFESSMCDNKLEKHIPFHVNLDCFKIVPELSYHHLSVDNSGVGALITIWY